MKQYTLRIDELEGVTRESVVSFMSQLGVRHFMARELSDVTKKWHYQGWFWTDHTPESVRTKLKKRWPVLIGTRGRSGGTGSYSIASVRKESYELYCCKGDGPTQLPDVVTSQFALGEVFDVEAKHRQWHSTQVSTPSKKVHIVDEGIATFNTYEWDSEELGDKRFVVMMWMTEKMVGKGHDSYRMAAWLNGIMNGIAPDHRKKFSEQIAYRDRW